VPQPYVCHSVLYACRSVERVGERETFDGGVDAGLMLSHLDNLIPLS